MNQLSFLTRKSLQTWKHRTKKLKDMLYVEMINTNTTVVNAIFLFRRIIWRTFPTFINPITHEFWNVSQLESIIIVLAVILYFWMTEKSYKMLGTIIITSLFSLDGLWEKRLKWESPMDAEDDDCFVHDIRVLCCDVTYDFPINTMFSSSLPPVVCRRVHVLFTSNTYCVVFFFWFAFVLCLVYPKLPVSLDCPFLLAPSVLSNVYFQLNWPIEKNI